MKWGYDVWGYMKQIIGTKITFRLLVLNIYRTKTSVIPMPAYALAPKGASPTTGTALTAKLSRMAIHKYNPATTSKQSTCKCSLLVQWWAIDPLLEPPLHNCLYHDVLLWFIMAHETSCRNKRGPQVPTLHILENNLVITVPADSLTFSVTLTNVQHKSDYTMKVRVLAKFTKYLALWTLYAVIQPVSLSSRPNPILKPLLCIGASVVSISSPSMEGNAG